MRELSSCSSLSSRETVMALSKWPSVEENHYPAACVSSRHQSGRWCVEVGRQAGSWLIGGISAKGNQQAKAANRDFNVLFSSGWRQSDPSSSIVCVIMNAHCMQEPDMWKNNGGRLQRRLSDTATGHSYASPDHFNVLKADDVKNVKSWQFNFLMSCHAPLSLCYLAICQRTLFPLTQLHIMNRPTLCAAYVEFSYD